MLVQHFYDGIDGLELGLEQHAHHGKLAGEHDYPGVQPLRPHPGHLRHGRGRAHLRAAAPVRHRRAAEVLPVAGDLLQVVQRRQDGHLRDPAGREVQQRDTDDACRRRVHLQPGEGQQGDQPRRAEHLQRERLGQQRHAYVPHVAVHQPAVDRRRADPAAGDLEQGRQPGDVRRPQPGRHRALQAQDLHPAGLHADQEHQLLAGVAGEGGQRLLPGLHLQHRCAVGAVQRPDRLDRQLHPWPAEGLRRQGPAHHHFWEAPGSTNAFIPNLNKWPTNQLPVRKAISLAVNRTVLASEGEAGLENPVLNASGITLPTYSAWSAPVASDTVSATSDAAAAQNVLKAAGYTKGSNGFFQKGGKTVSITLISPSAYTDYAEVGSIAAQELKNAGIDANFQGISVNAWNQDMATGNFTLAEHWSNGGVTPYNLYDNWLDSALSSPTAATGDYEGLKNPAIDSALATLAGSQTVAQQTAARTQIGK